ncbi:60S ribosomal protein L14 [Schistocerca nitens]|uniref:60S ribosomal protein L14 n=1 Tax=Schistocerca nitens TaxID=7011 RepID=UPI00211809FF|nr:60S ribosomal protein L14 [Schistocerca nitens]
MPFKRFVETGRVAYISDGPHKGKLCSIVDVIDQNKALIDGPVTGVPRGEIRLTQLHLTKFRVKFPFTARSRVVRKAWLDGKVDEKWKESLWAKKLEAKQKRVTMTDFDRFKLRKAKQLRNKVRSLAYYKLKKKATRAGTLYGKKKSKDAKKEKKPKSKPAPKK